MFGIKSGKKSIGCILYAVILILLAHGVLAQDKIADELRALIDNGKYDDVISRYASGGADYSAKALYYVGYSYYVKEDDANCVRLMNLSIAKDRTDPGPFNIKGSALYFKGKYTDAIECFKAAISLNNENPVFHCGMGDSYYQLGKPDKALESYDNAISLKNCPDRPYVMRAQIYSDKSDKAKALEAYYAAKSHINNKTESYFNVLFNIGLFEMLSDRYDRAETAFLELIKLKPDDYRACAKLIQINYHRGDYAKAKPYKDRMYDAHVKGTLEDNQKDMFCFDQFWWKDKLIQAYERYESGDKQEIYCKLKFYVLNQDNKIERIVQTEYSPVLVELGQGKYALCGTEGNTHSTYATGFGDDIPYDVLKKSVIGILEGKIRPGATSRPAE